MSRRDQDIELATLKNSNNTKGSSQQEEQGITIFDLPTELVLGHGPDDEEVNTGIGAHLSVEDRAAVACTSRYFYELFSRELEEVVNQLLLHVVRGEQEEAERLIRRNPELLLKKGQVTDYSGRTIEGTAFGAAVAAEDVGFQPEEQCMAEMIAKHLDEHYPGEKEKQYAKQFPEGWEEAEALRQEQDLEALNTVVDAIGDSNPDEDCEAALQTFRDYLEGQTQEVITTGKHFNAQLLISAFELYEQKYNNFGGWDSRKNNLFWCKVIGYIQRFLPACYAQAFCQGLYYLVVKGESLQRSLEFRYGGGVFFPLDSNPNFRLGVDYASPALLRAWGVQAASPSGVAVSLRNYVEQKQQDCKNLCSIPSSSQSPSA